MKIPFQIHRHVPLVRRPFFQRDRAIQERDAAIAQRDALIAERDAVSADWHKPQAAVEVDGALDHSSSTQPVLPSLKTVPLDRRLALCGLIDIRRGKGIELGPLSTPIVTTQEGDIRYVDHASTEALRKKYAVNDGHDVSKLVDITYVWSQGALRDAIHDGAIFDYAIASHVIEHVPDMISWLNEIFAVLRDGGILSLAIPDSRYTFDRCRSLTPPSILIDNWLRRLKGHSPQQVFDHFSQVVKVGYDEIIALFDGKNPKAERYHSDDFAMEMAKEAAKADIYTDCHASVFTPRSFLAVMKTLIGQGLINGEVIDFYDTRLYSQEFVCILKKSDGRDVGMIVDLLSRLK